MGAPEDPLICRRCGRPVATSAHHYDVFEQMHYVCFHYEFEHDPADVDSECSAGGCPSRRVGLSESLADWTDWDLAAFRLGRAIGLYEREDDWWRRKGTMWTDNLIGAGLHDALVKLAEAGVLDQRHNPDEQFRWRRL
jgi:hypothetical protein